MKIGQSITGKGETLFKSTHHPIDVGNFTQPSMDIEWTIMDRREAVIVTGQLLKDGNLIPVLTMVFPFIRANDINERNIIKVKIIFHPAKVSRRRRSYSRS